MTSDEQALQEMQETSKRIGKYLEDAVVSMLIDPSRAEELRASVLRDLVRIIVRREGGAK